MFGLAPGSALAEAVVQLTRPHQRTIQMDDGPLTGQEAALLNVLERAVHSDSGKGSAAGVARTGSPVDLTAMALWDKLHRETTSAWPGRADATRKGTPLTVRLEELTVATAQAQDTEAELQLWTWALGAIEAIQAIVEPPKRTALRGTTCPKCGNANVLSDAEDGGEVFNPCLMVHLSEYPVRAECLVCGSTWSGGELLDLKALTAAKC